MTAPLCFIDTETTGLHPRRKVWDVAMIRREPNGREVTSAFFVEVDLGEADPFGLQVGRFWDRHPLGMKVSSRSHKPSLDSPETQALLGTWSAAERIAQFTHGAHLVGAVPNFDTETLAPLLREHGLIPSWHYHLIDVENLAVGYLSHLEQINMAEARKIDPDIQFKPSVAELPWDSEAISRALHVEPPADDERHTALGDARWAMRMYDAVMGGEVA